MNEQFSDHSLPEHDLEQRLGATGRDPHTGRCHGHLSGLYWVSGTKLL